MGPGASLDAVKKRISSAPTEKLALTPCSTAHSHQHADHECHSFGSRYGPVMGSYGHSNKSQGLINVENLHS